MRTLKKSLALMLVVVMVLSIGMIGANAAFTDVKEGDSYKQAIDVMTSIGVINGMTSTTFDPNGFLTREQAAKIIAYMLLGPSNAALISDASTQRFTDVEKTRWSAGYIEYCANLGIINGVGDNRFDPEGKLTVAAFTKLLLCAIGYDAAIEKFTGESWAVNVASAAVEAGVFQDGVAISNARNVTRGEACQLAFLTLKATLVDYETKGTTITVGGIDIVTGASKAKEVTSKALASRANIKGTIPSATPDTELSVEFAEKYFTKLVLTSGGEDNFGRPASKWVNDSKTVGTYPKTPLLTYTSSVKESTLFTDTGASGKSGTTKYIELVELWVDGELDVDTNGDANVIDVSKGVSDKITDSSSTEVTGTGTLFEVYKTDNANEYIGIVINEYFGTVASVTKATSSADRYITIASMKFETEDFARSDKVIYTVADGEIETVELSKTVTNVKATSYSSSEVTAGGTTYKYNMTTAAGVKTGYDSKTSYTLFLDSHGNVISRDVYEVDNSNYVMVLAVSAVKGDAGFGDTYQSLKYVDGEGKVSTVKRYISSTATAFDVTTSSHVSSDADTWYTLSEDSDHSDGYNFKAVAAYNTSAPDTAGYVSAAANNTKLSKTQPGLATGIVANSSTVFVLKTGTDTYKIYTGISNVPGYESISSNVIAVVKSGYANLVYIDVSAATQSSSGSDDLVYVYKNSPTRTVFVDNKEFFEWTCIINGNEGKITSTANNTFANPGLYKIASTDSNGYVKTATAVGSTKPYTTVNLSAKAIDFDGGTLMLDTTGYTLSTSVAIYKCDNANSSVTMPEASELSGTCTGTFYLVARSSTDDTIVAVYFAGTIS